MKQRDFIATYFTLAGNVGPFDASRVSPNSLVDRARAAAAAGYAGIGFGDHDLAHLLALHGAEHVNAVLYDHGLHLREVEVLFDWFTDGDRRVVADRQRRAMLDAAQAIGARHIKVAGDGIAPFVSLDRTIEAFAGLCDDAAAVGVGVTIELFPPSSIASLETGRAIVGGAARANGGLLLDIWHMVRGGITMDAIACLPVGLVSHVELDDGPAQMRGDFIDETINHRLPPGEGAFPLAQFRQAIAQIAYDGPIGIEILSHAFRAMDPQEAARRSFGSCRDLFD